MNSRHCLMLLGIVNSMHTTMTFQSSIYQDKVLDSESLEKTYHVKWCMPWKRLTFNQLRARLGLGANHWHRFTFFLRVRCHLDPCAKSEYFELFFSRSHIISRMKSFPWKQSAGKRSVIQSRCRDIEYGSENRGQHDGGEGKERHAERGGREIYSIKKKIVCRLLA